MGSGIMLAEPKAGTGIFALSFGIPIAPAGPQELLTGGAALAAGRVRGSRRRGRAGGPDTAPQPTTVRRTKNMVYDVLR